MQFFYELVNNQHQTDWNLESDRMSQPIEIPLLAGNSIGHSESVT